MSAPFEKGIAQNKEKFGKLMNMLESKSAQMIGLYGGISEDALAAEFRANSKAFQKACYGCAAALMPGHVSSIMYAAVAARVAKHLGLSYTVYGGFCLQKSSARYARDKADWEKAKARDAHPFFVTHIYTECNGVIYENLSGDTSNIDHLDVVEIARA